MVKGLGFGFAIVIVVLSVVRESCRLESGEW